MRKAALSISFSYRGLSKVGKEKDIMSTFGD